MLLVLNPVFSTNSKYENREYISEQLAISWKLLFDKPDSAKSILDSIIIYSIKGDHYNATADAYQYMGIYNTMNGNYKKAEDYYFKAKEQYQIISDSIGIANCYANIAVNFEYKGLNDSALYYNKLILDIRKQLNDLDGVLKSNINIGVLYYNKGYYLNAQESYFNALNYLDTTLSTATDSSYLGAVYVNIASTYFENRNFHKAIEYYEKAMRVSEQTGNKINIAECSRNLGSTFVELNDYKSAATHYSTAVKNYNILDHYVGLTLTYSNLANMYLQLNNIDSCKYYLLKGNDLLDSAKSEKANIEFYQVQGRFYNIIKKYNLALESLNKALQAAKGTQVRKAESILYKEMAGAYAGLPSLKPSTKPRKRINK